MEHINCSDVESQLARAAKWFLMGTSNMENIPKVRFFVSSRNKSSPVKVKIDDEFHVDEMDFKIERRTVLIVHGFQSGVFDNWVREMKEAFLLWGDVNVVAVQWTKGMRNFNYYQAAISTKAVGNMITRFLLKVMNATRAAKSGEEPTWGALHLVGHSLGAHVCANAAKSFSKLQDDWAVSRITGLDPAELCFRHVHPDFRLDESDANFVDVIHTSGATETALGFGWEEPLGKVDFFPNGGKMQPGCSERRKSIMKFLPKTALEIGRCNHARAHAYFIESLVVAATGNGTFSACPWNPNDPAAGTLPGEACYTISCTEMGILAENHPQRGTFSLSTSASPPFCHPLADSSSFSSLARPLRLNTNEKILKID